MAPGHSSDRVPVLFLRVADPRSGGKANEELLPFPMISNQFQSLLEKILKTAFENKLKRGRQGVNGRAKEWRRCGKKEQFQTAAMAITTGFGGWPILQVDA
jgi:hypothetical protein